MGIGSDILVFISATRALLQSVTLRTLTDEEHDELQCCLQELLRSFPPKKEESRTPHAA